MTSLKRWTQLSLTLIALATAHTAHAWNGTISFTEQEKQRHLAKIDVITATAARCLDDHWADQVKFFKEHVSSKGFHLSRYYGNRRYIKGDKPGVRADGHPLTPIRPELRSHGFDPDLEDQLVSMSCVDLSRACLAEGFAAAGQTDLWQRIDYFNVKLNGNIGPAIEVGLQALGWKLVYWNPDPSQNAAWDAADQKRTPDNPSHVWGYHAVRYNEVMTKGRYYEYTINDKTTLVGFKNRVPDAFRKVPFFIGFAHTGYHVFVGYEGNVIEAHSVRDLFAIDNMQNNPFNPLSGGAPMWTNTEVYLSGVIATPPGSL